ncbi:MAG: hypothetical protein ACTHJ7_04205, partial [Candidatus Nitrosocosmicus sp.]
SKKNLDKIFGTNDLKKLTIKGRVKYPAIPPINPKDQNIRIVKSLFINHHVFNHEFYQSLLY